MISGIVSACFFVQFMLCTIAPISWWYPIFNQTMSHILKTVICKASIILRALPALSFSMPFLPTPHTLVHLFFHSTNEHYSWVCFRPGTILGPMNIAGNKKQKKLTSQSSSERGYRPKKKKKKWCALSIPRAHPEHSRLHAFTRRSRTSVFPALLKCQLTWKEQHKYLFCKKKSFLPSAQELGPYNMLYPFS